MNYKSKIEEAFPNNGRRLFESEKAEVAEFNERYRERLSPNQLSPEELEEVRTFQKVVGVRENPFPRRFDPIDAAVLKERRAILKYLANSVSWEILMNIEEGKHLER